MTTGRINQIANVISPTHSEAGHRGPASSRGARKRDVETPRSRESCNFLDSNHSRFVREELAAKETVKRELIRASEHPRADAHGRDVFPLLTHKPSVTRKETDHRRTPSGEARRRLVTIVPKRAHVRSSLPTARESGVQSRDQWFARFDSCVENRQATQTSPKHQRDR